MKLLRFDWLAEFGTDLDRFSHCRQDGVAAAPSNSNPFHTYIDHPYVMVATAKKSHGSDSKKPREKLTITAPPKSVNSGRQGISIVFSDAFLYFNGFSQWFLIRNHPETMGVVLWLAPPFFGGRQLSAPKDRPSSPVSPSRIQHMPSQAGGLKGMEMIDKGCRHNGFSW